MKIVACLSLALSLGLAANESGAVCTYPQGSVGTSLATPAIGYITSLQRHSTDNWKWVATYTYNDPMVGAPFSGEVDFGQGQTASFESTSPGWTGAKITNVDFVGSIVPGCPIGKMCMRINGVIAFIMPNGAAMVANAFSMPDGVTKIRGMGPLGLNRVRFYHVEPGGIGFRDVGVPTANCTASVDAPRDWRFALAPRHPHPDALTIERLLHG